LKDCSEKLFVACSW